MKKEAAGKLLAQYITGRGTINPADIRPRTPLLSKIWKWIKDFFSKITRKQVQDIEERSNKLVSGLYNMISSGEAIQLIDKQSIIKGQNLYALQKKFDTIEKVAREAESLTAKARHYLSQKPKSAKISQTITDTSKNLKQIQELNTSGDFYDAVETFLGDARSQMSLLLSAMVEAKRAEEKGWASDIALINRAAKVAREIDDYMMGYESIINAIANFAALSDEEIGQLGLISHDSATELSNVANECRKTMNALAEWRKGTSRNIMLSIGRTVYKEDKVRGIGSKRQEIVSLEQIIDHAERDINVIDRWFSALSDADDAYLVLFDSIVKNQQYERDMIVQEYNAKIAAEDLELRKAGFSSDFMLEKNEKGVPKGRIISIYDWDSYNDALNKRKEELRKLQEELGESDAEYRKNLETWKDKQLIKIYVDPEIQKAYEEGKTIDKAAVFEMVPNPEIYNKNIHRIDNLAPAQKKYYNAVMAIKRDMMLRIPHRGQGIFKAIYISKDFAESILDNSSGNIAKAVGEHYVKKFVRRPDDIGFGTTEAFYQLVEGILKEEPNSEEAAKRILRELDDATGDDILSYIDPRKIQYIIDRIDRMVNSGEIEKKEAIKKKLEAIGEKIASENFYIIDTDFADHKIQKLPIYYTRPLKREKDGSMPMLSTDFSGSLVAYCAMAVNYEKMNEVVDILEIGRSYAKEERQLHEKEGNNSLLTKQIAFGKIYKAYVERAGSGTNIASRLDDYMSSVVYEERKNNEGTADILGVNLDVAKSLDAIKDYTGLLGLGFNLFSTVSNIAVGKLQQWIEAAAGEYFTVKDYAKAVKQYTELMFGPNGCLAEINSPVKKNKLSLLIQMFDPMADYFEGLREANYNKSAVSRILGNGVLAYVGMNAGEHLLHCQTMLAILNNIKLQFTKDTDGHKAGDKISLFDALEVKEVNGIYKLVLKDNLAYERDLIDQEGKLIKDPHTQEIKSTNPNFGKPIKDENGKIKTELVPIKDSLKPEDKEAYKNFRQFIIKKKRVVRKVNDSLNGAFGANDKGAIHKMALGRMVIQFRQWMPAHYERRFARAHYDADLEQWREGYYLTVAKVINQLRKDCKKAGWKTLQLQDKLSEHEKANLRRATAEIGEFLTLMWLVRLGGKVKDRDRNWLDKMALYQIRRMHLEVGASMPINGQFFDNIFTLLQSPAASINTFEKFSKILQIWNMFDEIQTGRYQGWSEWERDIYNMVPALGQITKAIKFDDSMFSMFERED